MKDIKISKEQAQEFATAIYADIAEYIKNHQAEYQKFLADNGGNN